MSFRSNATTRKCNDCGAVPPEWGRFDIIAIEGIEYERYHCSVCDGYGVIVPVDPEDIVTARRLLLSAGTFIAREHSASPIGTVGCEGCDVLHEISEFLGTEIEA